MIRRHLLILMLCASALKGQVPVQSSDSVSLRMIDVELRAALQSLSRYLDRPLLFGALPAVRVSIETPSPVHKSQVPSLISGLLESHDLLLQSDSGFYRVRARQTSTASQPPKDTSQAAKSPMELFVIRLRHAKASEVASTVNSLYGRASAFGEPGAKTATLTETLRGNQVPPIQPTGAGATQISVGGKEAALSGEVTIIPDPRANSLLIRAARRDYDLIAAAVNELDVRPLQVLIELLIAEVRHDRSLSFGVESTLPKQTLPGSGTSISGATSGAGLGDFVLKLMQIGGLDIDATLRAAASRGDVAIVSRPVIITANNHAAEILVGSQRPFVQVSRTLPTDSPLRDQVVQYKEVGTKLQVLPTISSDGYVMLEVTQEVNAATAETAFDAPIISTRLVQTRLLVKDGQTVALGGLTDKQRDTKRGGVPLLSGIPLVGGFFGRATRSNTETELFLFMTPRVLRSDEDADAVTRPMKDRTNKIKP